MWFVAGGEGLYVRTLSRAGKVRRLGREPRVRVAACDRRGAVGGAWYSGEAVAVCGAQAIEAGRLLRRKYGLLDVLVRLHYALRGARWVVYRVIVGS